jgi:hypothetical protein
MLCGNEPEPSLSPNRVTLVTRPRVHVTPTHVLVLEDEVHAKAEGLLLLHVHDPSSAVRLAASNEL